MKQPAKTRLQRLIWLNMGLLAAVFAYALLARAGIGPPCLFRRVTGLLCPGCGNTRAALALLRLDFGAAWGYNPLCFLEFFYIGWVYLFSCRTYWKTGRFSYRPPLAAMDVVILVVILAWGVIRNLPIF